MKLWTTLASVLLISALAVSTWGLLLANYTAIQKEEVLPTQYGIPSLVGNAVLSLLLMSLLLWKKRSHLIYISLAIVLLLSGVAGEIYLVATDDISNRNKIGLYILTIFNFLIRSFYLLDMQSVPWIFGKEIANSQLRTEIREAVSALATPKSFRPTPGV